MEHPFVSIVIPVYNVDNRLLERCLESVVRQTYSNIEVLIINDGSKIQENLEICNKFSQLDHRIKVYEQSNKGVSAARNVGISKATGTWLTFVDADDYMSLKMIEEMVNCIDSKTDIVLCDCNVLVHNEVVYNAFFTHGQISKNEILFQILGNNKTYNPPEIAVGTPWGKLYRKELIEQNDILFPEGLARLEDNIFNLYAFEYASSVKYIRKPYYFYNRETESVSNRFSDKVFDEIELALKLFSMFIREKYPDNYDMNQAYFRRIIQSFNTYYLFYFKFRRDSRAREIFYRLLERDFLKEAMQCIDLRQVSGSMLVLLLILKIHSFDIYTLALSLRSLLLK